MTKFVQTAFEFDSRNRTSEGAGAVLPRPRLTLVKPEDGDAASHQAEMRVRDALEAKLAPNLLEFQVTNNRHTMISVKREQGLFRLRLHRMFLQAEPDVLVALARYVARNDRRASRLLSRYIDQHQDAILEGTRRRRRPQPLRTEGTYHNLATLYQALNQRYFAGTIDAQITWGSSLRAQRVRRHRSIKMGSYSVEDRLIRIHPSLDRDFVPSEFVASVIYHEMLHQKHDIPVVCGRRKFHTEAFLAEEKRFEGYARIHRWERENLDRLLRF